MKFLSTSKKWFSGWEKNPREKRHCNNTVIIGYARILTSAYLLVLSRCDNIKIGQRLSAGWSDWHILEVTLTQTRYKIPKSEILIQNGADKRNAYCLHYNWIYNLLKNRSILKQNTRTHSSLSSFSFLRASLIIRWTMPYGKRLLHYYSINTLIRWRRFLSTNKSIIILYYNFSPQWNGGLNSSERMRDKIIVIHFLQPLLNKIGWTLISLKSTSA